MRLSELISPNRTLTKRGTHILFGIWTAVVLAGWLASPFIYLPKPGEVMRSVKDLWLYQDLGTGLIASLGLNIEAIAIATMISLLLAYSNTIVFLSPVVAFIGKLRFLSLVGLSFFFTLVTTSGHELKVAILVFAVTVFFVVSMVDVINSIPKEQYDLARTLKMGRWETLYEVVILGQADQAFVVLRQNAAMSWLMISVVESMVRSGGGIGAMLMNSNRHFHMAEVFAIQSIILLLGLAQDYAIVVLRRVCCPYADLNRKR